MISIFIATAGRPEMFRRMLDSLIETSGKFELEIIAVIDMDAKTRDIAIEYSLDIIDYSQTKRGALTSWNIGLSLSHGNLIVPAGDDQLFHSDWLEYAVDSHNNMLGGYGVVGMNDLAYDGNKQVATMWLFDRKYCQEQMGGIFAPPCYEYLCVDSEWNEKAKMLGRFYWDSRSIVEHLHSAHGKRPFDDLDKAKDEGMVKRDTATFNDRKSRGFPIEWTPLI